jgi:hypothetical protein
MFTMMIAATDGINLLLIEEEESVATHDQRA